MDRVIVYPGALPQDTDLLNTNKNTLMNSAAFNAAVIGRSGTFVAGLACAPTAPASLQVTVDVGSIYQVDEVDAAAYGSLGTDAVRTIMKQGIHAAAENLTITPPTTTGFSQVYLVQAILQDVDSGAQVLSYYNSSNPLQPYSGPNNSGTSNFTQRLCKCIIALKAGTAATTGTQVTPAPDAGYIGLYAITVPNGAATITSGNIVQLPGAPFFPTLPSVPGKVQQGSWVWANDTGAANAYVMTFGANQPIPTSYVAGMGIRFKAVNANTGASTINVNGLGNVAMKRAGGAALQAGDILSGQVVSLVYDGVNFQMENYLGVSAGSTTVNNTQIGVPFVNDTGAQNAIVANFSPAITSGQQTAGLLIEVEIAHAITGACTINVNGLGAKNVTLGDGTRPPFNVFTAGMVLLLSYDGTEYQIVNTAASMFYLRPTSNYTIYVNTSTGSDTLYDGTSATVGTGSSGPFKTIQHAVNVAFGYAPSQFTITISVAAGTYNETVLTPLYAGPNIIIDGGSPSAVLVNGGSSDAITVQGPNTMTCQNIGVQTNLTYPLTGFASLYGSVMICINTQSGNVGAGVFYTSGGTLQIDGNHTFNGSSASGLFESLFGGLLAIRSHTFTFSAPISVPGGVVEVQNGTCNIGDTFGNPTFVNSSFVNGPKYHAFQNGVINNAAVLPGNSSGTADTGGQVA